MEGGKIWTMERCEKWDSESVFQFCLNEPIWFCRVCMLGPEIAISNPSGLTGRGGAVLRDPFAVALLAAAWHGGSPEERQTPRRTCGATWWLDPQCFFQLGPGKDDPFFFCFFISLALNGDWRQGADLGCHPCWKTASNWRTGRELEEKAAGFDGPKPGFYGQVVHHR